MNVEGTESESAGQPLHAAGNPTKGLAAWLMEIGRETAPLMNDGRTLKEMMDELYGDETGLPK